MTRSSSSSLTEIADSAVELARLRASADDILGRTWSVETTRKLLDGPAPVFDAGLWQTVTDLGWPDVLVSDARGGGGGGLRQLCVLAEAAGAAAAPVPLAAVAAAGWCEDRCTDGISLLLPDGADLTADGISGVWPVVPYGAVARRLLVSASGAGTTAVVVIDPSGPGVVREPVTPLDHNPAARITLQKAPIHDINDGPQAVARHRDAVLRARVAQIAELVGIASAANDAAIAYSKMRVAFGRPIGTYQAIKHRLVDHRTAIEVGRALVNRAAAACEDGDPEFEVLVSLAAFWGLEELRRVSEGATQVFGGIAYTWEHDAHVHLRRAATAVAMLGPRAHHRDVVTRWLVERQR